MKLERFRLLSFILKVHLTADSTEKMELTEPNPSVEEASGDSSIQNLPSPTEQREFPTMQRNPNIFRPLDVLIMAINHVESQDQQKDSVQNGSEQEAITQREEVASSSSQQEIKTNQPSTFKKIETYTIKLKRKT